MPDSLTSNFSLPLPNFNKKLWQEDFYRAMRIIDAVLGQYISVNNLQGVWDNATVYTAGQRAVDEVSGVIYECLLSHTSPTTGTFAEARTASPLNWEILAVNFSARGEWVASEEYSIGDFVAYTASGIFAMCIDAHTSSGTFANDSSKWAYLINLSSILSDINSDVSDANVARIAAEAAQSAAVIAKTAAETAETNAETARDAALVAKTAAETAETNAETAEINAETAETNAEAAAVAAAASESAAATSAANALTYAARMSGTSTSSVAIAVASKSFTTQASKFFTAGTWLLITSDADPANYMHGQVTSYVGTALTVNVTNIGGSGTFADWTITVSGTRGAAGSGSVSSVTATDTSIEVGGTAANPTISRAALTGDVTASAGSNATTIANDAVTYAKLQNITTTQRILARKTAGSGDVEEATSSEVLDFIGSTRGSLLYRGASGWTALTPGTSGYYLKSNGSGADPSYVAPSVGAWEFVSTVTLSNQATADFQSLTSGYDYLIAFSDVYNVSASGGELGVRVEIASSWLATSYESALRRSTSSGAGGDQGGATTYIQIAYNIGGATSRTFSGEVLLIDPGSTAGYKNVLTSAIGREHTNNNYTSWDSGGGMYTGGTGAVTGLRMMHSSANLTGTFKLYRRARS